MRSNYKRDNGICSSCSNLSVVNKTKCELCLIKHRNYCNYKNKLLKEEIIIAYGGKCSCINCPERNNPILKLLTIDHINNDGAEHRQIIKSSQSFYLWLKKNNYPKDFRLLCFNCNSGRHINNGVCPHEIM